MNGRELSKSIFCFAFILFLNSSCLLLKQNQITEQQPIFQSNFEGSTNVVSIPETNDYGAKVEMLIGEDNNLENSNWTENLKAFNNRILQVQYTGGDSTKRYAKVVSEPGNTNNHVLKFWLNDSWSADLGQQKARVQTNLYGINPGLKEFYQSVRVYLTEDFRVLRNYPEKFTWLTLSEFWNNEWWDSKEKYGFRIGLTITKPIKEESDLYFRLNSEDAGQKEIWEEVNKEFKVPIGKWFTLEYYFKEGNDKTGRFYVAVIPDGEKRQEIFDVKNFTHNTKDPSPNGITGYNPMKLYTSKDLVAYMKSKDKTLQIYWDDFKLWTNRQPERK
ncbi:hypothetical protein A5893_12940 [Pedobacter psychrophilus]|uniref:Uncharacterized protein n=1 Tax=Pedobacter psychrophilus TaxID=1826909 RepID=A0A179DDA0_9SPHI|nr:hypothetical protein [Pedobacter psychrophilus]OAQ38938.1 hypothetical protein A5893_12940 [Pedobacter psychrophilus]